MAKKLISLFVAAMMLLAVVPSAAFARVAEEPRPAAVIDTVEITGFTPPVWGEHPDCEVEVPSGAHYSITDTYWYIYYSNGVNGFLFPTEYFNANNSTVSQVFNVTPEEGYTMANDVTVTINGDPALVDYVAWRSDGYLYVTTVDYHMVEPGSDAPNVLHAANVDGFVEPVPGMTCAEFIAGLTVPEGANYTISAVEVDDMTDGGTVGEDIVLEAGREYQVSVTLTPIGDYIFWYDTVLTANGGDLPISSEQSGVTSDTEALIVTEVMTCAEPPHLIDTVEIYGFTPPVWGAAPDNDVSIPADAHYSLTEVGWYIYYPDGANGYMPEDALFNTDGSIVSQSYRFVPEEGYSFASNVTLLIDGSSEYAGTTNWWSDFGILAASSISFHINEPAPLPGLDEALNKEGGTIHFESAGEYPWIVVEEDGRIFAQSGNAGVASSTSVLTANVTVEAGDQISFDFKAWGEGTGTYWDHCDFYVGETRVLYYGAYDNDWENFTYTFETAGDYTLTWSYTKDSSVNKPGDFFAIDDVEITEAAAPELIPIHEVYINGFEDPVPGDLPADHRHLTIPDGANYSFYDQQEPMCWFNSDGYEIDTAFVEGEYYSEGGMVMANEGYYFAADCVFYLDGTTENTSSESWVDYGEYPTLAMGLHTPVLCGGGSTEPIIVDTIYVNDIEIPPFAGEAADDHLTVSIPDGEPYTLQYIRWFDEDNIAAFHDNFIEGGHYSVNISVGLPEGYQFAEIVTVYINGQDDLLSEYTYNYGDSFSFYTIPFECVAGGEPPANIITEAYIDGFTVPVWNEHPDFELSVPAGAHYTIGYVAWTAFDTELNFIDLTADDLFNDAGLQYYIEIHLVPEEGWDFTDDCVVYINGGEDLVDFGFLEEGEFWVASVNFSVEDPGGEPTPVTHGDVDLNGTVQVADAILALRYQMGLIGLTDEQLEQAEVNGKEGISIADSILILRYAMGIIDHFPIED